MLINGGNRLITCELRAINIRNSNLTPEVFQSYEIAALVSLLEKKGLLTKAEIIEEIKNMRDKA